MNHSNAIGTIILCSHSCGTKRIVRYITICLGCECRICWWSHNHKQGWLLPETISHGCVAKHSICLVGAWIRSDNPGTQSIQWGAIQPSNRAPKLWVQIWQDLQNHQAILMVVCVVTWNHQPWICYQAFHMSCGCMDKVWQPWNTMNTMGCHPTKQQSTQAAGPCFVGTAVIKAVKGCDLEMTDLLGAFLHMGMDEHIIVVLKDWLAEMMAKVEPKLYRKCIVTDSKGQLL